MSERSIVRFESLTRELSQLSETLLALDDILGEIPDEFADGLMGTLMQVRSFHSAPIVHCAFRRYGGPRALPSSVRLLPDYLVLCRAVLAAVQSLGRTTG